MNNHRLLTGLLAAALPGAGVCASGSGTAGQVVTAPRVVTLEEVFEAAENGSAQLRPSFSAEEEARREISVAKSGRLPEISASLSVSYIGDGFTTARDFTDYQKAPIPHFGNGLAVNISQPLYTGGAISGAIELAELKSTAARYETELNRDNIRFRLAGFYLDLYKYSNLREVVECNIAQARKVLDEMHARYEQGVALQNDITRYELLVSNLDLQLVKIDNTLAILNDNLVVTAGLPEGTVVRPDSAILARSLPTAGEGWWQQEAADNSPTLKLARQGLDISRQAEVLTRSELMPKIGIQAGWSIDGPI
ncbi:MAG: TolC family protein, partial [Muribaculaceae bacterium]|nr:TolC family protein [Muribaculaceae bacterium]